MTARREFLLLLTLAGIQFTHLLDFMIMMPLGPELTQRMGLSDPQFATLVSSYNVAAACAAVLAATCIDRFDRKRLLLGLYAGFVLATLACAFAPNHWSLLSARVLAGVFGGVLSAVTYTIVADVVPFERRGKAMGIVMSAFSITTVAGVPLGLWMATLWGWRAPFFGVAAVAAVLWVMAQRSMPTLNGHLQSAARGPFEDIATALRDPIHWRAFALSFCMMAAGFIMIPFITIYLQANAKVLPTQVPLVYLCGGVATLVTARLIGVLSDSWGNLPTFALLAVGVCAPMLILPWVAHWPLVGLLPLMTVFFVFMSGRMIPGMALVSASADPRLRGTFMTLNSAVISMGMGAATLVGGCIVSRNAAGELLHYGWSAAVGSVLSLVAVALSRRLVVRTVSAQEV